MASVEEKVEEYYKAQLDKLKIRHYGKTESVNRTIDAALKNAGACNKIGGFWNFLQNSIPETLTAVGIELPKDSKLRETHPKYYMPKC